MYRIRCSNVAETIDILNQKKLSCLICVGLLDLRSIPCGHSYCKVYTGNWDQDDQNDPYHICLQCRQTYTPRPALYTNTKIDEVVEKCEKTRLQADDTGSGNLVIYSKSYTEEILRKHTEEILSKHMLRNQYLVSMNKRKSGNKPHKQEAQSPAPSSSGKDMEFQDPEPGKTQELYAQMDDLLDRVTQNNFQQSMKTMTEFTINTEARLRSITDLIYDRAIAHPASSVVYANMCHYLMALKVPTAVTGVTQNFRKLLLNRVKTDFENMGRDNHEILHKEMDTITKEEDRQKLREELEEVKAKGRRQSLGNIQFMCELYRLKMITEAIMHDAIVKLLKNHDEDSMECLCTLLSTIGKELDFEEARPRMDQYYNQIEKILTNRTTSPRITSMLQDVLDLRKTEITQLAEKMEKTRLQADDYTGPVDTEPFLRPHYKSSAMKKQELVSISTPLQENVCPHHDDKLKAEDHETDSAGGAAAGRATKKASVPLKTCQQIIQEREEELQKLRQEVESLKCLSQATLEDGERFFTKLIETRCSEVRERIQAKEKEMVREAEGLIQTLEQELDELKRTETEGRQLPHIEDFPHFLQKLPSITEAFGEVKRMYATKMQKLFENTSKRQFKTFYAIVEDMLEPYTITSLDRQAVEEKDLEDVVDLDTVKTEEMYAQMDDILDRLTPKNYHQSMKVVSAFTIDTEDKLKGFIDRIYEKAIEYPTYADVYAKVCHHHQLMGLKVPGVTVNFRKLLLNRCQKGFEKKNSNVLKEKQRELDAITEKDRQQLREELEEAKGQRELLGNIKFMCELFKLKMITEAIMHNCIVKLLKNGDDGSLEGLCTLLFTIGKDLEEDLEEDSQEAETRMDQYYRQIGVIVKRKRTSPRIHYMLCDAVDLRGLNLEKKRDN
ncbi:uncharacterized protein LOC121550062 isoform X2 [Coregonus clupeaformis]|uniref:uncharacterized protein LOC121550062 isoform X2 n=1 Tax=Coregonus clupeaformis TaxID=59861 RepID=UPI001BE0F7B6|nr:uncharacterized protein LOC121550062 isoform X2 [Coregonus clupeaformis]